MTLDNRTRSLLDPIHGLIRLTELEMRVIDHPLFQRMRNIKQNGLLHLVFPAATHTRFEHSLGVMFVAHGMLNSLALNSKVGIAKGSVQAAGSAEFGEAVAFPDVDTPEWTFLYQVTRLAALAHDLGHGPLSHTFDSFAPTRALLAQVLAEESLAAIWPLKDLMLAWGTDSAKPDQHPKNRRTPHELMSCVFFTKIWQDIEGPSDVALAVCAAILGDGLAGSASAVLPSPMNRMWVPLIHDIVASAPADADRMDYMERDSRSIGVTYGLFDRNRVLKSLLCYRSGTSEQEIYRLGVKQSGLQAIENLMQARYELFVQVYYHKTNRGISLMLGAISAAAERSVDLFANAANLSDLVDQYVDLSDEQFFRSLLKGPTTTTPEEVKELAQHISERQFWKRILTATTKDDATSIRDSLHNAFPDQANWIKLDESKPKALKDMERGAALLFRDGSGTYRAGKSQPWTGESAIIKGLDAADSASFRLYFEKSDPTAAKQIRVRALQLSFQQRMDSDAQS